MANIVFMGTPEFAVPAMKSLIDAGHTISLLVCQPDKRKGRGHKFQFPPTKQFALEQGIEVFQPAKIRTKATLEKLDSYQADFFVVIAYGRILTQAILDLPKKGCINVHASLLPEWRGAAPIQFSLLNGDKETGVCTMMITEELDSGDLLLTEKTEIGPDELVDELTCRLSEMGARLIAKTINEFDQIPHTPQDHEKATFARMIQKEDRQLNWNQSAKSVYCQYRALTPYPRVFTTFRGKRLMIRGMCRCEDFTTSLSGEPGTIMAIESEQIVVACADGFIGVTLCQPENKKAIPVRDFVNGYQVKVGEILGGV